MCEDVDLYDDLPLLSFGESISKIEEERRYFKEQVTENEKDLQKLKEEIAVLKKDKKILEDNISSLFKTAVNEIKRKDQLIADLRREKDSIIFRRKGRWNNSVNATSCTQENEQGIGSSIHNDSASPANHTSIHGDNITEESHKTVSAVTSSGDTKSKSSDECLNKTSEKTPFLYKKNANFHHKRKSDIEDTVLNTVSSENCSSKVPDTSFHHFSYSSHPLHIPRQCTSPEPSGKNSSKDEQDSRSLSSENRREYKPKQSDNYVSLRARRTSPHSKHRCLREYNEKGRRDDKHRYHSDNRNNYRDKYKESSRRDEKFKVHNCNEFSDKYHVHSRRSPNSKLYQKHAFNPSERYSHSRYISTNPSRNTKMQTESVRLATQLKFKYSKAMREKSVSCSPVKRKKFLQKSHSPVSESSNQSSSALDNSALKLDVEKNVAAKHINNGSLKAKKISAKTLPKHHETEVSNCAGTVVLSFPKQSDECKMLRKESDSEVTAEGSVQDHISTGSENCGVAVDIETEPSHLKQKNISFLKECVSNVKKNTPNELIYDTGDSLENANVNKKTSEKISEVSIETSRNEKSFLGMNAVSVELSGKEKSSHEEVSIRLSTTPPSKNLTPLKISPSFENPAIVEESRFSHCVFNEQCEFKRRKRKKFKKLLVADFKNKDVTDTKEKECNKSFNGLYFERDSSGQQKFNSGQQVNLDSAKDCVRDDKVNSLSTKNISLKDDTICNSEDNNNACPNRTIVNEINPGGNCSKEGVDPQEMVELLSGELESNVLHKSVNISCELPNDKVHRNKTTIKKRKLDSICDELKANLEKKTTADSATVVPTCTSNILSLSEEASRANVNCNNNDQKTSTVVSDAKNLECSALPRDTAVHSEKITKRVIISKRRRRVPNLQDNVVQVLTQVKSTTP